MGAESFFQRLRRSLARRSAKFLAPWSRLRLALYLDFKGVTHARDIACIGRLPLVDNNGSLSLGSGIVFRGAQLRPEIYVDYQASLSIGANSYVNQGVNISCRHHIEIGERCLIAESVAIFDSTFHPLGQGQPVKSGPIHIGNNVWIGHRATLLPGVSLGDHCVVGTGAVVTRSFPARTIIAGVPARAVGTVACDETWRRP